MATKSVQKDFLDEIKKTNVSVTVFLVNGIKLQGLVTFFDDDAVLLRRDGHTQLIYKHAISTIMPSTLIELGE
ncbi:MAG: RNA chaperone Hfq [Lactobacillaceae bacterium]|jgi:host factor-I protein|nr:RNA chaperone Hfq [Lactobacillaceae bacterium]